MWFACAWRSPACCSPACCAPPHRRPRSREHKELEAQLEESQSAQAVREAEGRDTETEAATAELRRRLQDAESQASQEHGLEFVPLCFWQQGLCRRAVAGLGGAPALIGWPKTRSCTASLALPAHKPSARAALLPAARSSRCHSSRLCSARAPRGTKAGTLAARAFAPPARLLARPTCLLCPPVLLKVAWLCPPMDGWPAHLLLSTLAPCPRPTGTAGGPRAGAGG
jgi:hypothetical protein